METPGEMFWRVAKHMAKAEINWGENGIVEETARQFFERMVNFKFIPGGKALFEAGNPGGTGQLSSCFVLPVTDNIHSIFKTLGEAAVVHKNNGGTGFNFSHIRPSGDKVKNVPGAASGPVDFLLAYSAALSKILQGSKRQGANIGILNCDHPDIYDFIRLKDQDGTVKNFNISVGVTNEFMQAVEEDKMWELINPRNGEVVKRIKARKLFDEIAEHAWKTGDPGLAFLDRMEEDNPTPILGKIEATNPCITGDALIPTDKGLVCFEQLYKQKIANIAVDKRVQNQTGIDYLPTTKIIDQGEKDIYTVSTKSGFQLKGTAEHKIMTVTGWKEIQNLNAQDKVYIACGHTKFNLTKTLPFDFNNKQKGLNGRKYKFNLPLKWSKQLGQVLGYLVGDGTLKEYEKGKEGLFCLTFSKKNLIALGFFAQLLKTWFNSELNIIKPVERSIQLRKHSIFIVEYFKKFGISCEKASKKVVPLSIFSAPKLAIIGFLQGLYSADGTVGFVPGKSAYIRLTSKSQKLLSQVQLLLLQFGIKARIYNRSRTKRRNLFPKYRSASGELLSYDSDGKLWELEISKDGVPIFLKDIGFMFGLHQEKINKLKSKKYYKTKFTDQIVSVIKAGRQHVYDLTEPLTHSFIANGIVVHNCGEIPLLPYESCNLCSIVLSNHLKQVAGDRLQVTGEKKEEQTVSSKLQAVSYEVDWDDLEKSVKLAVRLLDDMIEVNSYALPEIEQMVKFGNRRIGLGVMGFAHMLFKLGIAYDSEEAVRLSERLAKFIRRKAEEMSLTLGEERGVFPNWDRSIYAGSSERYRNCALCMIAPTGTISMLADCSSGIEPVFSLVTVRKTFFEGDKSNRPTEQIVISDPIFKEFLTMKQFNNETINQIFEQIAEDNLLGNIEQLNRKDKRIFVTSQEIAPKWHIKIQAAWQKHFDNSVSKTINFPHTATVDDVKDAYMMAWRLGCKGITIYRDGSKQDQVLNLSKTNLENTNYQFSNSNEKELKTQNSNLITEPEKQEKENLSFFKEGKTRSSREILNLTTNNQQLTTNSCPECGSSIHKNGGVTVCHECGWSEGKM